MLKAKQQFTIRYVRLSKLNELYFLKVMVSQGWTGYDNEYAYRSRGATDASKKGAVAALIGSLTPFSMNTLYAGQQTYRDNVVKIPAACITVEDANMMRRMQVSGFVMMCRKRSTIIFQDRGDKIVVNLNIQTETLANGTSRNTIADLVGSEDPDHIVAVTAHTDSWDAGVGAMDNGGGTFMSIYALRTLKELGLRPKRTIRYAMNCIYFLLFKVVGIVLAI